MTPRAAVLLSLLCALPTLAHAQFEGVLATRNLTIDEVGVPQHYTITFWIKKDRVRIESGAIGSTPATTMIYRNDRRIVWVVNDADRSYYEILKDNSGGRRNGPSGEPAGAVAKVERKGKSKKILGYPCERVLVRRVNEETEIWGTKDLGDLGATIKQVLGEPELTTPGSWMEELEKLGLYPLAASTRIEGKVVESQETVRIERCIVAAEKFDLPAGYRKQDVGEMGDGLPGK